MSAHSTARRVCRYRWQETILTLDSVIMHHYTDSEANRIAAIVDFKADLQLYYNQSRQFVVGPNINLTGHAALPDGGAR